MKSRDFCYWLQGFFELNAADVRQNQSSPELTNKQVEVIRNHLNLVFAHEIDPEMGDQGKQAELNEIHKPAGSISDRPPYKSDILIRC